MATSTRSRDRRGRGERTSAANERRRTARGLAQSLDSTAAGLDLLLRSLHESGFAEALGPYRQMHLVLAQQRAWTQAQGREELQPHWHRVAQTAGKIHQLLAEMATIMSAIENIESVRIADQEAAPDMSDEARVGDFLHRLLGGTRLSPRRAAAMGIDDSWLQALTESGMLEPVGWGRGRSYRVSTKALERLSAQSRTRREA